MEQSVFINDDVLERIKNELDELNKAITVNEKFGKQKYENLIESRTSHLSDAIEQNPRFDSLIQIAHEEIKKKRAATILEYYLRKQGYVCKSSNALNYSKFANIALIPTSSLSKFFNVETYQERLKTKTLQRIIIALRMPHQDAVSFLHAAGSSFYEASLTDMLVSAFINSNYLGTQSASDALIELSNFMEYYSAISEEIGEKPLKDFWK